MGFLFIFNRRQTMVKLRRITEATDSSHTSIMYNMADSFKNKGWYKFKVKDSETVGWVPTVTVREYMQEKGGNYVTKDDVDLRENPSKNSDIVDTVPLNTTLILEDEKDTMDVSYSDKGMTISFKLNDSNDPHNTKKGKEWLKNNKDKDFIFKGNGLIGNIRFNIIKNSSGKRELIVDNVIVGKESNLTTLQKKLKASTPKTGKLTGKSVQLFEAPKPYIITNLATPTFQSYLKKTKDGIIEDVALALSEIVELPKKESASYIITYDDDFNRIDESYITESDDNDTQKKISWKDEDVQKAITDTIKGIEIDKSKTTEKELVFKHNGKNGSLHLQGYMLVLDTDTDDDIPATNYPVKDKNNLTIENLLDTIKTVFSRRESKEKNESYLLENNSDDMVHYVLKGWVDEYGYETYDEVVGDMNGYSSKEDAIQKATDLRYNDPKHVFGVTGLVDVHLLLTDSFWDSLDDGKIDVIWNSFDLNNHPMSDDLVEEKRVDEEELPSINNSVVFQDVAKDRLMEKLSKSLHLAKDYKEESGLDACDGDIIWVYLTPSYAINPLSNIVLPLCLSGRTLSIPVTDIPDPNTMFGGDYSENALSEYDHAVQDYLINDAPMSDIAVLDTDNSDEIKASIVDFVNKMSEDYQNKKSELEGLLDIKGESLLNESRYFIVPEDTDLSSDKEVEKLTKLGYTDLSIAQNELGELADSGRYNFGLKILDTHFSNNKEKWEVL